jgi:hypothetical protein
MLGRCCICETYADVTVISMLYQRAPVAGTGWGCVVCGLKSDGAIAVFCPGCFDFIEAGGFPVFVCVGPPSADKRMRYADLQTARFEHDLAAHRRDEMQEEEGR